MKWHCFICTEIHEDIPFEATKDGQTYYWTIGAELPEYPYILTHEVSNVVEARAWLISEGYEPVAPPEGP